ncbi:MAG: Fe-S protein assembly co-chaperone HscB [Gammaproteobacteria bacterium]|jgi:molecular chaperone HscB|nr:Fe-S protein assembly co-chaperone HscB [Gammaproteobacteria bacterium]MBT4461904.1 Fe-S protein assembly co-chaperone HscB [Gammaproteobacteria bacterium]MBT4654293.1 Fe-S protein assembly co-chaperone HscB [Gammaproteobacteria bacterium]MBT5116924.1 Fe-S protein assembly co-chaperone HscB [Gammaproteobacteria bacterium]MBT5761198.1 Fe-S protein assembly co-chaperone HscB [Gammaproteobacteria bacterium]
MDILKKNFFELFNINISIDINKSELDEKVKIFQTQFHPDKYANGSDLEKRLALQISSHVNDGYKVLGDIVLRIEYILKINNFTKDESKTINDINFLREQIEYNELVESLEENFDKDIIDEHLSKIRLLLKNTIDSIKLFFDSEDYENMWQNLSKLRFYTKNINELIKMRNK